MGRMTRRLVKQHKKTDGVGYEDGYVKLTKETFEELRQQLQEQASADAVYRVFTCACAVVYNDWHALTKKDTRLKTFYEKYKEYLEVSDAPTLDMIAAERALYEQTGLQILREGGGQHGGE